MSMIIKGGVEYAFGSSSIESGSSMEVITREEYDTLVANGTVKTGVYYFITEDESTTTQLAQIKVSDLNSSTASAYDCNWQDYKSLIFTYGNYGNIYTSITVTKGYFKSTGSGTRILLHNPRNASNEYCEIYQNGEGSIMLKPTSTMISNGANYYIRVYRVA